MTNFFYRLTIVVVIIFVVVIVVVPLDTSPCPTIFLCMDVILIDFFPGLKMNGHSGHLLPTGSEESEVFGVGSIPVAILPSCQYMINIVL